METLCIVGLVIMMLAVWGVTLAIGRATKRSPRKEVHSPKPLVTEPRLQTSKPVPYKCLPKSFDRNKQKPSETVPVERRKTPQTWQEAENECLDRLMAEAADKYEPGSDDYDERVSMGYRMCGPM